MKVIAVDPGYGRAGVAVLERAGQKETLLTSCCIETSAKEEFDVRLRAIGTQFEKLLKQFSPGALAIESLYFGKNKKTAIGVAEVRGVFRYLAAQKNIPLYEYNPMTVKAALAAGDKREIIAMVERLLALPKKKRLDDEYDAIAIGLTHLAHHRR